MLEAICIIITNPWLIIYFTVEYAWKFLGWITASLLSTAEVAARVIVSGLALPFRLLKAILNFIVGGVSSMVRAIIGHRDEFNYNKFI